MRFSILGPLLAESATGPIKISGARRTALLGALVMDPGQLLLTSDLIDAVWAERPPASAIDNIRTYVSQLRKKFQRHDGDRTIVRVPGGYRCEVDTDDVDLTEFRRLDEEGRKALASGDLAQAQEVLGAAAGLWRGNPLEGVEVGGWLKARIDGLTESRCSTTMAWAEARLGLGDHDELVAVLTQMVADRPLQERTWELLLRSLYGCGRTAEALATYQRARRTLVDELGIEPGPKLQKLHARMLAGDSDLTPQARTQSIIGSGIAHPMPADLQPGVVPHLLPPRPRQVVGRRTVQDKIAEIGAEIHQRSSSSAAATPVVALCGAPGIGKSAAAIDSSHELRHLFADGELYVDLQGHDGRSRTWPEAVNILLSGLGISGVGNTVDERLAAYRYLLIDRRLLLLLDNAIDAEQVRPLLPIASASLVIVTSRRRLVELDSQWNATLGPLDMQDARRMLSYAVGPERIDEDPEAASQILDACDGVPLAVRAAGARLATHPSYPIRALADRLTRSTGLLGELAFGNIDVRGALHDSYRALPEPTRLAFRAIGSQASASITPRSLGNLLDVPVSSADRLLEQLLLENLLKPRPSIDGEPSYEMLDLMRAYAREELSVSDLASRIESERLRPAVS